MIAYFCLGGKQYIAQKGDILIGCPYRGGEAGDIIYSTEVLGINDTIGSQAGKYIEGAKVELRIVKQGKNKKIRICNFKPQKRHRKWKGFRRKYTNLEVVNIYWSQ